MDSLRTPVKITAPSHPIRYGDRVFCFGSCFAAHLRKQLDRYGFGPYPELFGTLFHPVALAKSLTWLVEERKFMAGEFIENDGRFHHFDLHSRWSAASAEAGAEAINGALDEARAEFQKADHLVLTLGTAWAWQLKETDWVVANCHRFPDTLFEKRFFEPDAIVRELQEAFRKVQAARPNLRITLTVSPVRHLKEGAVGNQRSKAALHLACQRLCELMASVSYFPSYEIMLDDLRDYRFYQDDMLHPTPLAVRYIWDCFAHSWLDDLAQRVWPEIEKIARAADHRPEVMHSHAHQRFVEAQLEKVALWESEMKEVDLSAYRKCFQAQLITQD